MTRNIATYRLDEYFQGGNGRGVAIIILALTPILGAVLIKWQSASGLPMIVLTALVAAYLMADLGRLTNPQNRSAHAAAYRIFTLLVLAGAMYMAVASDRTRFALWLPQTFEHWSIVMWCLAVYAVFLPMVSVRKTAGTDRTDA